MLKENFKITEKKIADLGLFMIFLLTTYSFYIKSYESLVLVPFAAYFLFRFRKTKDLRSLRIDFEPAHEEWSKLFWFTALSVIVLQMITTLLVLPQLVKVSSTYAKYVNSMAETHLEMDFWSSKVLIIILAPWLEEIFFRGFLQRQLGKIHISVGILFSALIFASLHLNVLGALAIGLIHGFIAYKTKSLVIPMLSHFSNNLAASLLIDTPDNGRLFTEQLQEVNAESVWYFAMSLLTTYALSALLLNLILEKKRKKVDTNPPSYPIDSTKEVMQDIANHTQALPS